MSWKSLEDILSRRRTLRDFDDRGIPRALLHRLLWAAQGETDAEGKRTAPSAHALYPLSLRVISGRIEGLAPGMHAVARDGTSLTLIAEGDIRPALQSAALEEQPWLGRAAVIVSVCANFAAASQAFAEQPPYGARGARYIYIEAGAAAQNLQLMATAEGLGCVLVAGFQDEATAAALELSAPIAPVLHLCLGWPAAE